MCGALTVYGLGELAYYAMTHLCTPHRIAPDYWDCWGSGRRLLLGSIEHIGVLLAIVGFAATFTLIAPSRKRLVAYLGSVVGVAFGVYLSWDSRDIINLLAAVLASIGIVLWAHRRYPRAHVA
jgi:hypothetical protein